MSLQGFSIIAVQLSFDQLEIFGYHCQIQLIVHFEIRQRERERPSSSSAVSLLN